MKTLAYQAIWECIQRFRTASQGELPMVAFVNKAFAELWHQELDSANFAECDAAYKAHFAHVNETLYKGRLVCIIGSVQVLTDENLDTCQNPLILISTTLEAR